MENNEQQVTDLAAQIMQEQLDNPGDTKTLEGIKNTGMMALQGQLDILDQLKQTVTLTGVFKAIRLALSHEVFPEGKKEYTNSQQFLAAHFLKAVDLRNHIKNTETAINIRSEEKETKKENE